MSAILRRTKIRSFLLASLAAGALAPSAMGCSSAPPDDGPASTAEAESVGGTLFSAPGVCSSSPGHYDVFVQGGSNSLWHRPFDNGVWGAWDEVDAGLPITSKPACVENATGRIDLFVRGNDGAVWNRVRVSAASPWQAWHSLGGWIVDGPAVVSDVAGHLDVFVQGGGNVLYRKKWRAGDVVISPRGGGSDGWSDWTPMYGAAISSAPAAVSWGPNRIDVVARELGTNTLLHNWSEGAGDWWGGWENKGGYMTSGPAITSRGDHWLTVYTRGTSNALQALPYNGHVGYGAWTNVPLEVTGTLPITSDPAAFAVPGIGCDHIFARDQDNALYHRGCGEINKIKLDNLPTGTHFETTANDNATYAFDSSAIGPESSGTGPSSFTLVDGFWPRELLVLDKTAHPSDVAIGRVTGMHYASVPGYNRPTLLLTNDFGPYVTGNVTPWPVRAARLVDHGTCQTRMPYHYTYSGGTVVGPHMAFYSDLEFAIDKGLNQATAKANAQGAGVLFYLKELTITPSYLTADGSTDPRSNLDGFAMHLKFEYDKPIGTGDYATLELTVDAAYQLTLRDGMIDVVPVGDVIVNTATNWLYDFGTFLNGVAQVFGGDASALINFFPGVVGADDWVNLVPRSIPSTGSIEDLLKQMFGTMLPQMVRAQALAQFQGRDATGQPIGVGICRADLDATSQRQSCFDQRLLFMKAAIRDKLVSQGMAAAAADATATTYASGLQRDSFDCAPVSQGAAEGVCRWHPHLNRLNVMPDRLELVWYDGTTPSADYAVTSLFAPASARALMCMDNSADNVTHLAAPMPVSSFL